MKRKVRYLIIELVILFFVFVQYMVNFTVEEKKLGQAVSEQAEVNVTEKDIVENSETSTEESSENQTEKVEEDLANKVASENAVSKKIDGAENNQDTENDSKLESTVSESNLKLVSRKSSSESQKIRVLLKTTDYRGNYHESVKIIPTKNCVLSLVQKKSKKVKVIKTIKAGKSCTIKKTSSWLKKGTLRLTLENGGKIKVCSIKRTCGNPSYRGTLELKKTDQGIVLINELPLEEYLYAVVPSEMPVSYGIEALQVQAVCARCYAYSQLGSSAMKGFSADVDDSTSYQVYNNIAETKLSIKAVEMTKDIVAVKDGKMITAYYYSTSCGYTANMSDAWGGGNTNGYLVGKPQFINQKEAKKRLDLSSESNFQDFLTKETRQTFDSAFPWYRWSVTITKKSLQNRIEKHLKERAAANPDMLKLVKNKKKRKLSSSDFGEKNLGKWKSIEVISRSSTGMLTCVQVTYKKAKILVYGEYNIRCIFAPETEKIKRQDGSIVTGLSLLPSSFFYFEEKKKTYVFHGGGYGHGVGMSQNGVKTMAEKGYGWKKILKHYYQGIALKKVGNIG